MAQPVRVDTSLISVTGGHLGNKELVVKTDVQDGRAFVTVDRTTPRFRLFLGGDYSMMDCMIKLRNHAVDCRMEAALVEDDPLAVVGAPVGGPGEKLIKRKAAYGDIGPDLVDIKPVSADGVEHVVTVRPHWYKRAKLSFEATVDNFEIMLKKPQNVSDNFRPVINAEGVTWNKARSCVWLAYFDGKESHTKSLKVHFDEDWGNEEKQLEVDRVVHTLLEWYDANNKEADDDEDSAEGDAAAVEGHADALLASQEEKDEEE